MTITVCHITTQGDLHIQKSATAVVADAEADEGYESLADAQKVHLVTCALSAAILSQPFNCSSELHIKPDSK